MSPPYFSLGFGDASPPLLTTFQCCGCALPLSHFSGRPSHLAPEFDFDYCHPPFPPPDYAEAKIKIQMRPDLIHYIWQDG
jgi:hypothetical protein